MDFIHQVEPYITEHEGNAVQQYLKSGGWLTEFKQTQEFEKMLSDFLSVRYAASVTSGTVALYLSLLSLGIGERDNVIVPNYTMIATINAVKWAGAEPIIVDVDPQNLCMDITNVPLNANCKALIYVSINGRSGNMSEIIQFCKTNSLVLIEDACQSLGSKWDNQFLGTFGDIGIFSFTPHKIITTGQGGVIVTNNEAIYTKVKKLKDFNRTGPASDWHDGIGYNFKFTDLQAVVGIEQMKSINSRIKNKKELFQKYQQALKNIDGIEFFPTDITQTTPWFIDVLLPSREARDHFIAHLKQRSIGARAFYPPLNHQKPYSGFSKGSFPNSESIAYRGAWLPSSIGLENTKIEYIGDTIKELLEKECKR